MHVTASKSCPVSTGGPGYYVVPAGLMTDQGMLCLSGIKPGDTLDIHKPNTISDIKPLLGLVFVKFREDDESQAVFKKAK